MLDPFPIGRLINHYPRIAGRLVSRRAESKFVSWEPSVSDRTQSTHKNEKAESFDSAMTSDPKRPGQMC